MTLNGIRVVKRDERSRNGLLTVATEFAGYTIGVLRIPSILSDDRNHFMLYIYGHGEK
jgi:hypothetical protein